MAVLSRYNREVQCFSGRWATVSFRCWVAGVLCAPMVFLTGCPEQTAATTVKTPVVATAPALVRTALPNTVGAGAVNATASRQNAGNAPKAAQDSEQARRVQALMQQVDRSYQSGVLHYRANKLDAARMDFDFAVDLMLTSGIDIKSDAALNEEFERTVNAVNALEMDALKQGNGFSPKTEESPVETAGDLTFPPDAALVAKLSSELNTTSDLPLVINDEVAGYINYFANSPSFNTHMRRSLERAGRYRVLIQNVLKEEGVPQDLIYLAVAESGFQLQVINAKSGAGGMWQFMPFQGAYGLQRNGYFDERFDPEKSSRAYARYIKTLYKQFGDWYLAMAAYDWGPGNVQRAVMRTGYADFWQLYRRNAMPKETREYVPKILAAVIMAKNPAKYGLTNAIAEPQIVFDTVPVDYAMDLRLAADVTGTTLANLVALNPALLRLSTPSGITYDLHVPGGTKADFQQRMSAIPVEKRASWRFHEMRAAESLEQVAQLFHVSDHDIRVANDLDDADPVGEGDELVVPVNSPTSPTTRPLQYTAQMGDSLITIADRFNVSTEELRSWNHLGTSGVETGATLYVAEPVRLPPAARGHVRGQGRSYRVVRGRGRGGRVVVRGRGVAAGTRGGTRGGRVNTRAGGTRVSARSGGAMRTGGAARVGGVRGRVPASGGSHKKRR